MERMYDRPRAPMRVKQAFESISTRLVIRGV